MNASDIYARLIAIKDLISELTVEKYNLPSKCSHVYKDGTSALGRSDGMGAGQRVCNACRGWVEG